MSPKPVMTSETVLAALHISLLSTQESSVDACARRFYIQVFSCQKSKADRKAPQVCAFLQTINIPLLYNVFTTKGGGCVVESLALK